MAEYECPTCGAKFETRRGVGVHHSAVHDERLPNRTCAECGDRFYSEHEKKYCSEECRDEGVSLGGKAHPNYSGGKTATTCEICDREFEYYPSNKEGKYCSDCVETENWREPPTLTGSDNPRWKGGKVSLTCAVCDADFERYPANVTGEVAVCSEECRRKWLSETFEGDGHPNWQGGGNQEYGTGWNEVRRDALERDRYQCVVCGATREELGRNPDVHHIEPVRAFRESDDHDVTDAHYLENVVSLCIPCHRKAEFGKIPEEQLRKATGENRPQENTDESDTEPTDGRASDA